MPSATTFPNPSQGESSVITKDTLRPTALSREERNHQLALHHAHLIQYRKDIEARNLASTEALLDFPQSPTAASSDPSVPDTATVKEALRSFQPSDYDALVGERNIDHKCGYVLCPKRIRSRGIDGGHRVITKEVGGRQPDLIILDAKEVGKWCSDECGKMALYIRVQLGKEPAWSREWKSGDPLELYHERAQARLTAHSISSAVVHNPPNRSTDQAVEAKMKNLAIERGDEDDKDRVFRKLATDVKEHIYEKQDDPSPPEAGCTDGGSIEGYVPIGQHLRMQPTGQEQELEDLMPTI
ncbi:MAG: hypothetical protein Q9222_005963 [Ikaeria aurantiellina]